MTSLTPTGEEAALTPLDEEAAEQQEIALFDVAFEELGRLILAVHGAVRRIENSDYADQDKLQKAVVELRRSANAAKQERERVAKIRDGAVGGGAGGVLDLEAARNEVGRRLACLRADRDTSGVS